MSKTATCGTSDRRRQPYLYALEVGGVVQRAQRHELLDPGHDVVVDEGGAGEVAPALDDPVAHGHDVGVGQRGALLLEQAQHLARPKPWSGTGSVISVRSSPCLCVMAPVSSPMRSTRPEASEAPESGSTSWYLMEEEPELITRTVR